MYKLQRFYARLVGISAREQAVTFRMRRCERQRVSLKPRAWGGLSRHDPRGLPDAARGLLGHRNVLCRYVTACPGLLNAAAADASEDRWPQPAL